MNSDVKYLIGSEDITSIPLVPFDDSVVDFLDRVSKSILSNKSLSSNTDIISFAFWCRKNNILNMKKRCSLINNRLGKGLSFHVASSNIPTLPGYTYALGILSGNSVIVRVSEKNLEFLSPLLDIFNSLLNTSEFNSIAKRTAFVTYDKTTSATDLFSKQCDVRVIWGGDTTINTIRKSPLKPNATELIFPHRYSMCIMDSSYILNLDTDSFKLLVQRFFNDSYSMDQNACSSPKVVFWLGDSASKIKEASHKFWTMLFEIASVNYEFTPFKASCKYLELCQEILHVPEIEKVNLYGNILYTALLSSAPINPQDLEGTFGLFYEYNIDSLSEILPFINERCQTLTYAGLSKETLINFIIDNKANGITRVVPIGQALMFDVIWDGINIIDEQSRIIY